MNIALPKSENPIAAFRQVRVTSLVTLLVCNLNLIQRRELRRIAVPEVAIPLDNQFSIGNERVHDELTADYLLLHELKIKGNQNLFPCLLKFSRQSLRDAIQYLLKVSVRSIGAIITASVGAVFNSASIKMPAWNIERLGAGFAADYLASASNAKRSLSALLFSFCRVLPSVRTIKRTKANCAFAQGKKPATAPSASVSTASIASFCDV